MPTYDLAAWAGLSELPKGAVETRSQAKRRDDVCQKLIRAKKRESKNKRPRTVSKLQGVLKGRITKVSKVSIVPISKLKTSKQIDRVFKGPNLQQHTKSKPLEEKPLTFAEKRLLKQIQQTLAKAPPSKQLKIVLSVPYQHLGITQLRKFGIKVRDVSPGYFPYQHLPRVKLGHNHFAHINWQGPSKEKVMEVYDLLKISQMKHKEETIITNPAHDGDSKVEKKPTIDAIIQIIFAQTSLNQGAIDQHDVLCHAFPYFVNGRKVRGKMPDWHKVRNLSPEEFQPMLVRGGLQRNRAKYITELLNKIYNENRRLLAQGRLSCLHDMNEPNAPDFVPGMLSLDYLLETESGEPITDEELLGRVSNLPGIGLKSAMCILGFMFGRPVFVVDVHVLRMSKWLGWVPWSATEMTAAQLLHSCIPDEIKYELHQLIWVHCAAENRKTLCPYCGSTPPARNRDVSNFICPLESLLPPLSTRYDKKYRPPPEEQQEDLALNVVVTQEIKLEHGIEDDDKSQSPASDGTDFSRKMPSTPADHGTIEAIHLGVTTPSETRKPASPDQSVSPKKRATPKTPSRKLRFKKSEPYHLNMPQDIIDSLHAKGYLLWEFRPMDDNFMEDRGERSVKPRYKFEEPGIMDADLAVSVDYARAVLNGEQTHPWSTRSEIESLRVMTTTAMIAESQTPSEVTNSPAANIMDRDAMMRTASIQPNSNFLNSTPWTWKRQITDSLRLPPLHGDEENDDARSDISMLTSLNDITGQEQAIADTKDSAPDADHNTEDEATVRD